MKEKKVKITADQDIVNGKLSWGERIGWAGGEFTQNFMVQMLAMFTMMYLLDIALIPAAAISVIVIITKLIDGLNDIASGYLLDNFRLKLPFKFLRNSKFRPWLILVTPLCAFVAILIFSIPSGASVVVKIAWYMVATLLFGFLWDFVNGGHGAIMSRMTQNRKERNVLSMLAGVGTMIAVLVVSWAVPFAIAKLGNTTGISVVAIIFSIILVIGMYMTVFLTKERVTGDKFENASHEQKGVKKEKKYDLKGMFKLWGKNRALVVLFAVSIFSWLSQGFLSGMNPIYMKYYYGNLEHLWILTTVASSIIIPSLIIAPLIANKVGKKNVYLFGLIISGVFAIARGFVPQGNMIALLIIALPSGIGTGLFLGMSSTIPVDAIEYGQWKTGVRSEGLSASINNFLKKIATAFAASIPAMVLAASGYVANAEIQTPQALNGILWSSCYLPGICFLISAVIFGIFFPINRKTLDKMMTELNE